MVSVATSIGWATKTWNFFTGCSPISSGCAHCWARGFIDRGIVRYDFTPQFHPERLVQPQQWKRPQRVGVCLMSDFFHRGHSDAERDLGIAAMDMAPQHWYLLLTKRSITMRDFFSERPAPPSHLAVGVSVEDVGYVSRITDLRAVAAACRFISYEPALGPIAGLDLSGIQWVLAGPESGPAARAADPLWFADLREQCAAEGVAYFDKRVGYEHWREFPEVAP